MGVLTLLLMIIGIVYGGLTSLIGAIQLRQKKINLWASLAMIAGGILTIISVIPGLVTCTIFTLIIGLLLVHAAAIDNGFKLYGKINPKHHIIRVFISIALIIIYLIK